MAALYELLDSMSRHYVQTGCPVPAVRCYAMTPEGGARRRERGAVPANADLREAVLDATARLLDVRAFADLSVADVLAEAGVARGTFYFYFSGKGDVLAELVRRAVRGGHEAAAPWLGDPAD